MIRARWVALLVVCAFAALASTALANQITIGGPSTQVLTYTSNGNGSTINLAFGAADATHCPGAALCLSDSATFVLSNSMIEDSGTYAFADSSSSPIVLANDGGGVFGVTSQPGTTTFTYSATDGDMLSGTVAWAQVDDGSPNPFIFGRLTLTSISGDADFTGTYGGVGSTTEVDFNILGNCSFSSPSCELNNLVNQASGATLSGKVSGGEVAAEPGSIALLSLVVLGGLFFERKRLFA